MRQLGYQISDIMSTMSLYDRYTSSVMEVRACPLCASLGVRASLRYFQANMEDAVLMCPTKMCPYPLGCPDPGDLFIKRKPPKEAYIRSLKRKSPKDTSLGKRKREQIEEADSYMKTKELNGEFGTTHDSGKVIDNESTSFQNSVPYKHSIEYDPLDMLDANIFDNNSLITSIGMDVNDGGAINGSGLANISDNVNCSEIINGGAVTNSSELFSHGGFVNGSTVVNDSELVNSSVFVNTNTIVNSTAVVNDGCLINGTAATAVVTGSKSVDVSGHSIRVITNNSPSIASTIINHSASLNSINATTNLPVLANSVNQFTSDSRVQQMNLPRSSKSLELLSSTSALLEHLKSKGLKISDEPIRAADSLTNIPTKSSSEASSSFAPYMSHTAQSDSILGKVNCDKTFVSKMSGISEGVKLSILNGYDRTVVSDVSGIKQQGKELGSMDKNEKHDIELSRNGRTRGMELVPQGPLSTYLQWENIDRLCWLDVVLALLTHNITLRALLIKSNYENSTEEEDTTLALSAKNSSENSTAYKNIKKGSSIEKDDCAHNPKLHNGPVLNQHTSENTLSESRLVSNRKTSTNTSREEQNYSNGYMSNPENSLSGTKLENDISDYHLIKSDSVISINDSNASQDSCDEKLSRVSKGVMFDGITNGDIVLVDAEAVAQNHRCERKRGRSVETLGEGLVKRLISEYDVAQWLHRQAVDLRRCELLCGMGRTVQLETSAGNVTVRMGGGGSPTSNLLFGAQSVTSIAIDTSEVSSAVNCATDLTNSLESFNIRNILCKDDSRLVSMERVSQEAERLEKLSRSTLCTAREHIYGAIERSVGCVRGKNDSALVGLMCALEADLRADECVMVSYEWTFSCVECGHQRCDSVLKNVPTMLRVDPDFTLTRPAFYRQCFVCNASEQRLNISLNKLPDTFFVHFLEGLSHTAFSELDFESSEGQFYAVTGVIRYRPSPDHFIAWLRQPIE